VKEKSRLAMRRSHSAKARGNRTPGRWVCYSKGEEMRYGETNLVRPTAGGLQTPPRNHITQKWGVKERSTEGWKIIKLLTTSTASRTKRSPVGVTATLSLPKEVKNPQKKKSRPFRIVSAIDASDLQTVQDHFDQESARRPVINDPDLKSRRNFSTRRGRKVLVECRRG